MKSKSIPPILLVVSLLLTPLSVAWAGEVPPGSKPLSEVLESVEEQKLGVITEAEFDDGFWEVELRKDGRKSELAIDPKTGETRR